jgi:hypothetical protein
MPARPRDAQALEAAFLRTLLARDSAMSQQEIEKAFRRAMVAAKVARPRGRPQGPSKRHAGDTQLLIEMLRLIILDRRTLEEAASECAKGLERIDDLSARSMIEKIRMKHGDDYALKAIDIINERKAGIPAWAANVDISSHESHLMKKFLSAVDTLINEDQYCGGLAEWHKSFYPTLWNGRPITRLLVAELIAAARPRKLLDLLERKSPDSPTI